LSQLVKHRLELLPCFATAYHRLRALPKWLRRRLQRHWHVSLGGLALLLAAFSFCSSHNSRFLLPSVAEKGGCQLLV
jgi:hypothetical protein